jgi:hypothetical protein
MQINNAEIGRMGGRVAADLANALFAILTVVDFNDHAGATQRLLK